MLKKFFLVTAVFFPLNLGAISLPAATYYVDGANGNDATNPCTAADAACQTINGALNKVAAGDTIKIAPSTNPYVENLTPSQHSLTIEGTGQKAGDVVLEGTFNNFSDNTVVRNLKINSPNDKGVANGANLTLEKVIITGNYQYCGGGISTSPSYSPRSLPGQPAYPQTNDTTIILRDSTVTASTSQTNGGGICVRSNGQGTGTIQMINSTVSGNTASGMGGAVFADGGTVQIFNSTITQNNVPLQGGALATSAAIGGNFKLFNSILSNSANNQPNNCNANTIIQAGGFNLEDGNSCDNPNLPSLFTAHGDPLLDPLADNNGATPTHALLEGSPAIDAADPNGCKGPGGEELLTDQRGHVRVGRCDMGSFEYVPPGWQPPTTQTPGGQTPADQGTGAPGAPTTGNLPQNAPQITEPSGTQGEGKSGCALNPFATPQGTFWMAAAVLIGMGWFRSRKK